MAVALWSPDLWRLVVREALRTCVPTIEEAAMREPIRPPELPTATRYKLNPDWSWRGDNTKYREKK